MVLKLAFSPGMKPFAPLRMNEEELKALFVLLGDYLMTKKEGGK